MIAQLIFYLFVFLAIVTSLGVIFSANSVRAALCLVMTFVSCAVLWILLNAQFLGLILILVYVGAVMTLFLFVVMMLNLESLSFKNSIARYTPIAVLAALGIFLMLLSAIRPPYFGSNHYPQPAAVSASYSGVKALGQVLYTHYFLAFQLSAVILLVAIIASIVLTFRGQQHRKAQEPSEQIKVTKASRLRVVDMKCSQPSCSQSNEDTL